MSEKEREKESLCNSYAYVTRRLLLSLDTNQCTVCCADFFVSFSSPKTKRGIQNLKSPHCRLTSFRGAKQ